MLDYEQCLTCEDTCDDWFQEAPNQERETRSGRFCERAQLSERTQRCFIGYANRRWPDALALRRGGGERKVWPWNNEQ
jgi:hypothetical protein